jgi:hypothetical protein
MKSEFFYALLINITIIGLYVSLVLLLRKRVFIFTLAVKMSSDDFPFEHSLHQERGEDF